MLLRHVHHATRIAPLSSPQHFDSIPRSLVTTLNRSFSCLTRPYAKPRATKLASTAWKWSQELQRRGAKRKASVNLDDVPQGIIESVGLPPQDDLDQEYPPLLQQVRNNMLKFNHCVLLTRVGGFYEVCIYLQVQCPLMQPAVFRAC